MLSAKFKIHPNRLEDAIYQEVQDNDPDLYPSTKHRFPYVFHGDDGTSIVKAENQAIMFLIGKVACMGEGGLIQVKECKQIKK